MILTVISLFSSFDSRTRFDGSTTARTWTGNQPHAELAQDNSPNERALEHSQKNWETMLNTLKRFLGNRRMIGAG
jgi:hypothetical protein